MWNPSPLSGIPTLHCQNTCPSYRHSISRKTPPTSYLDQRLPKKLQQARRGVVSGEGTTFLGEPELVVSNPWTAEEEGESVPFAAWVFLALMPWQQERGTPVVESEESCSTPLLAEQLSEN